MADPIPTPPDSKIPIIAKWHKGEQTGDEFLDKGNNAELRKRTYVTPGGEESYAFKESYDNEKEIQRVYRVYKAMADAGLPVVDFLKTMSYRRSPRGVKYGLAMQDATEGGQYNLVAIMPPAKKRLLADVQKSDNYDSIATIASAPHASSLQRRIAEALAIIHNLGMVDTHGVTNFFLRVDVDDPNNIDFIILDYANFVNLNDQTVESNPTPRDFYAERLQGQGLAELFSGICDRDSNEFGSLIEYYEAIRASRRQKYEGK